MVQKAKILNFLLCFIFVFIYFDSSFFITHRPTQNAELWQLIESSPKVVQQKSSQYPLATEEIFYQNGRMTGKVVYWDKEPWEQTLIEYLENNTSYFVHQMIYNGKSISMVRKDLFEYSGMGGESDTLIESWYYRFDKDKSNTLRQVDIYRSNSKLVEERRLYDENEQLTTIAYFDYENRPDNEITDEMECIPSTNRMIVVDDKGLVLQDYKEQRVINLEELYWESNLPVEEIHKRLMISKDVTRTPILIFDSGIDISHLDLAHKIWKNQSEMLNGIDDDNNGLVDDIFGISDNPRTGQPVQDLRLPRFGLPAFSHGTLVASLATKGRDDVAVMAISEIAYPNSNDIFKKAERFIKSHNVKFTNMSFVFDKHLLDYDKRAGRPRNVKRLIDNTPETLHLVAAGNGNRINGKGFNVDKLRKNKGLVPVMLDNHNTLVVGAIESDGLNIKDYPTYMVAPFSNVGEVSVDILAPGYQLRGAKMGGGTMFADGTSFATPYVWNQGVMNIVKVNPDLDIYEIKEILLKTAYIPDLNNPFPVRSGGILHPNRAVAVAKYLFVHPNESVESAVITVRRNERDHIKGESSNDHYLDQLISFWEKRQIGCASKWRTEVESISPHLTDLI